MSDYNTFSIDNLALDANWDFSKIFQERFGVDDDDPVNPYNDNTFLCSYFDESEFKNRIVHNPCLSIMSLNIQSINAKFNEFSSLIKSLQHGKCEPDIICLQELWKVHNPDLICIDGYHPIILKSRTVTQGGGVGIYIQKRI
jgi:hypothetical protein